MESFIAFFGNLTVAKKWLLFSGPFLSLLVGLREAVLALFALVFLDMLTGIRKSQYAAGNVCGPFSASFWLGRTDADGGRHGGVRSYMLRQTWTKLYEYVLGILAVALVEVHLLEGLEVELLGSVGALTNLAVTTAGLVELWSIFENMEAVGGRNLLKRVSGLLPERLRRMLGG